MSKFYYKHPMIFLQRMPAGGPTHWATSMRLSSETMGQATRVPDPSGDHPDARSVSPEPTAFIH